MFRHRINTYIPAKRKAKDSSVAHREKAFTNSYSFSSAYMLTKGNEKIKFRSISAQFMLEQCGADTLKNVEGETSACRD